MKPLKSFHGFQKNKPQNSLDIEWDFQVLTNLKIGTIVNKLSREKYTLIVHVLQIDFFILFYNTIILEILR